MFLSAEELKQLTGRCRAGAQIAALRSMGVEHKVNAAGKVLVLRRHVEELLGIAAGDHGNVRSYVPNWGALKNAKAKAS
jgi:hypothetical protein